MVAAPATYLAAAPASASPAAPSTAPPIDADSLAPVVSDGSAFATVAADANGDLVMFYEPFGASRWTRQVISGRDDQEPSLAYSPSGGNYVLADADAAGDINSWHTTDGQGGWSPSEQVVSGQHVQFQQAAITMTSQGAVAIPARLAGLGSRTGPRPVRRGPAR